MSEDLFQNTLTESQDFQLRRSQRIFEKGLKTPSKQLFNAENKLSLTQTNFQTTNNEAQNKLNDVEYNKNCDLPLEKLTPTPDFTALVPISQNASKQNDYSNVIVGFNILQEQENISEKNSQLPLNLCIAKRQEEKSENVATFQNLALKQKQPLTKQQFNNDKEETNNCQHFEKEEKNNAEVEVLTFKTRKRSQSKAKSTMINTVEDTTSKIKTVKNTSQPKRKRIVAEQPEPTTKFVVKRKCRKPNRTLQVKSNSIATISLNKPEYMAPKVIRYHNSCPTITELTTFPYEHNSTQQSLLPPVYPPHFTNQIVLTSTPIKTETDYAYNESMLGLYPLEHKNFGQSSLPSICPPHFSNQIVQASTMPTLPIETKNKNVLPISNLPISLLTPDSSEIIVIKNSSEEPNNNTPSTPINSPSSLENFFQLDEINDLNNMNKTAYVLTELQISALACILKIDEDEFFTKLDEIVDMNQDNLMQLISNGRNDGDDENFS